MKKFFDDLMVIFKETIDLRGSWYLASRLVLFPFAMVWFIIGWILFGVGQFILEHPL